MFVSTEGRECCTLLTSRCRIMPMRLLTKAIQFGELAQQGLVELPPGRSKNTVGFLPDDIAKVRAESGLVHDRSSQRDCPEHESYVVREEELCQVFVVVNAIRFDVLEQPSGDAVVAGRARRGGLQSRLAEERKQKLRGFAELFAHFMDSLVERCDDWEENGGKEPESGQCGEMGSGVLEEDGDDAFVV